MKKKTIALAISIICMLVAIGGTVAYYTTSDVANSSVTASNLDIELVMLEKDETGNEKPVSSMTPVMPGVTVSRIAKVKNTGKESAWVRIKAVMIINNDEISILDGDDIKLRGGAAEWTWKDGYWYYGEALAPGEMTSEAFTEVAFSSAIDETYDAFDLSVIAEGTQSEHNGSSATDAEGWPN